MESEGEKETEEASGDVAASSSLGATLEEVHATVCEEEAPVEAVRKPPEEATNKDEPVEKVETKVEEKNSDHKTLVVYAVL